MNQRRRKRTVNWFFHHRFYNSKFIWKSAEDWAWDNMAPVGREFGSPDFERLMQEDADQMRATLARLVADCLVSGSHLSEATEFMEDTANVQRALKGLGHDVSLDTAARVWKRYSNSLLAGWMTGAQSEISARRTLLTYCVMGSLDAPGPAGW